MAQCTQSAWHTTRFRPTPSRSYKKMAKHWDPSLERGVRGPFSVDGSLPALPSEVHIARFSAVGFRYEEYTDLLMPIWSPQFKNQSDDDAVSTILAKHLDKDFVGAQPSPDTTNDAIIHRMDVVSGRFEDDWWISYRMGKFLNKQSRSPSSSFCPWSSFMTKILELVDRAPWSLDIVKYDQSSPSSPETATS